ncbi:MAG: hypothetical protein ACRYG2_28350 [Janthinobacterium lividum]
MEAGIRRGAQVLTAGLLLGLLAACGLPAAPAAPTPGPAPYAGPLRVAPDPTLQLWHDPGAAGRAVTCDQPVLGETSTNPFTGGEVGETPESGLQAWRDDGQWSGFDGELRAVRREPDRVLFTYAAGGRTLQAAVVHRGPAAPGTGAGTDGIAWWVESSARCDVVEYPDGLAESRGLEVWTDATGRRVSSQIISSDTSDGDCLTRGTRTLRLADGAAASREYLAHGEAYPDHVGEPYRADVALPPDAVGSGYSHGDERLWFSPDGSRAYVGGPDRVELWPRETQVLGCG